MCICQMRVHHEHMRYHTKEPLSIGDKQDLQMLITVYYLPTNSGNTNNPSEILRCPSRDKNAGDHMP